VAVTGNSIVHVVWEEDEELYHSYQTTGAWSTPSRVTTGEQPCLAAGPDDTVHLVFVNEIGGVYNVYYTRWDGADWVRPPRKVSDTSSVSDSPDVAISPDGHRHVVWTEDDQVYYGDSADGVIWSYGPFAEGNHPVISPDGNGSVRAAWQDDEWADYEIHSGKREDGSWSPSQNVSNSPSADSTAPELKVETDGTPHLVWQETTSATAQVQYSQGPEWTQSVTLSAGDTGAYLPSLTIDSWGRRHAAWEDFDFPTYRIRYIRDHVDTLAWLPVETLAQSASPSQQLEDVSLCSGPDGAIHAVWVETEDGTGEILYAAKRLHRIFLPLTLRQAEG
jgi:hypothetical protein